MAEGSPHSKSSPPKFAILGAGVCGLYAAHILRRAGAGVVVLERDDIPGGLAMGRKRGDNIFDLGVHMLHAHDEGVFEDMKAIMGEERTEVQLDAKIKWMGEYYRYPLQFQDMVRHMNLFRLAHYGTALVWAQAWYKFFPKEPRDAEEALIMLYGRPLYEFFFKEFTHRYWGIPATGLSATFIKSKMPRLSAVDVLKKFLARFGLKEKKGMAVESALLDEILSYSKSGSEALPRRLAEHVGKSGGRVLLSHEVERVEVDGRGVRVVVARRPDGTEHRETCDFCINTMPLPALVKALEPAPPAEVTEAAANLRFKAIAVYGLLVRRERCIDANYVYYRRRIFHRVGEPKNAGLEVTPDGHTVLIVEMTCDQGDEKWRGEESVLKRVTEDLQAEGICEPGDIVEHHVLTYEAGYPIFEIGFEPHFERIKDHLAGIPNLVTTGRQGGFCYPNMHGAMRMGADAAQALLEKAD